MKEQLINGVMPILVQAILGILGVAVTTLTAVAITYLQKKKHALITKIGVEQYNANYKLAKDIYFAVEQRFKGLKDVGDTKRKEFDKMLLAAIPYLGQKELDSFRESICGEINSRIIKSDILEPVKKINPTGITNTID